MHASYNSSQKLQSAPAETADKFVVDGKGNRPNVIAAARRAAEAKFDQARADYNPTDTFLGGNSVAQAQSGLG
jgi:hypothetical protein